MTEWILSSSVLILLVAALRFGLKGKISLRLQYALWVIVLVRLLLPVSLGSSQWSILNALPVEEHESSVETQVPSDPVESVVVPPEDGEVSAPVVTPPVGEEQPSAPNDTPAVSEPSGGYDWAVTAKTVWLLGVAVVGLWFLASNLCFLGRVEKGREKLDRTAGRLPVYISPGAETPCLVGLFCPVVYVTPEVMEQEVRLDHVLAHEYTHYRHGDHVWSVLRGVCLAVHWYNPLVWWAAFLSRNDAELACDEGTIARMGEDQRAEYGRTLIGMTCCKRPELLVTATTMNGSAGSIRERVLLIARKPKMAAYTLIAVLIICCVAVGCTFTGAHEEKHSFVQEWLATVTAEEMSDVTFLKGERPEQWEYSPNEEECAQLVALLGAVGENDCEPSTARSGGAYAIHLTRDGQRWNFTFYEDGTILLIFPDEQTLAYYGCDEVNCVLSIRSPELWDYITRLTDEKGTKVESDELDGMTGEALNPVPPWDTNSPEALSYEEYFAQVRSFQGVDGLLSFLDYSVKQEEGQIWVYSDDTCVWTVPSGDYTDCVFCYATNSKLYGVKNGTELFSVDWQGENWQTLFRSEKGDIGLSEEIWNGQPVAITMVDQCLLFFLNQVEGELFLHRVYLPDGTVDSFSLEPGANYVYFAFTSHQVVLSGVNRELYQQFEAALADPDSWYAQELEKGVDRAMLLGTFENEVDQPCGIYYVCDLSAGEMVRYGDWVFRGIRPLDPEGTEEMCRLLMERTI